MDYGEESIQWLRHLLDLGEHVCGTMGFGNLGVGQSLDDLHGSCRSHGPFDRPFQKEPAMLRSLVDAGADPGTEQAVAAAEVMIQEAQRCAHRKRVQPERDLG